MKTILNYFFILIYVLVFCAAMVCVKFAIAEAYNACLLRASRAALVRDKMKRGVQKTYKTLASTNVSEEVTLAGGDTDDLIWLPVKSEVYGPKREVKKRLKTKRVKAPHNTNGYHGEVQKELLTHRGAPFSLPLAVGSFWISSRFGPRRRPDGSQNFHYGLDLAANKGTPIYAARTGVIIYAGWDNGYGNAVVMKHGTHFKTRYAHLDKIFVKTGDTVARGFCIGLVGSTGHIRKKGEDGSHLHFEIHYHGKRVDPLQFLPDIVS